MDIGLAPWDELAVKPDIAVAIVVAALICHAFFSSSCLTRR
jgi:hypothetical protein